MNFQAINYNIVKKILIYLDTILYFYIEFFKQKINTV